MTTSKDGPPIGSENPTDQQTFISYKLTPKIDKAIDKIKSNKEYSTKQDIPTVVLLDNQSQVKGKSSIDQNGKMRAIETEPERTRLEQANILTTTPADTNTNSQLEQNSKDTSQR